MPEQLDCDLNQRTKLVQVHWGGRRDSADTGKWPMNSKCRVFPLLPPAPANFDFQQIKEINWQFTYDSLVNKHFSPATS